MPNKSLSKIVLINQSTGYLFIDIVNAFSEKYDQVVLFAGVVRPMLVPLNPKVKVVGIPKYNKKNIYTRTLSWVLGFVKTVWLLNTKYRSFEVLASSNPPTLNFLPLFCPNKVSLHVYDVYPDGLAAANFIKKNHFLFKAWAWLNKRAFMRMTSITTLTQGMADTLANYTHKSRVHVVPVWANHFAAKQDWHSLVREITAKFDWKNKFVIVYSGNFGKGYELECLVRLAKSLRDYDAFRIALFGDGFKKNELLNLVKEQNLHNCIVQPFQSPEHFMTILRIMSLGVVSLEKGAAQLAIPSKTFNILGAGKPILCLGDKNSNLAQFLENNDAGRAFTSDKENEMKDFIKNLFADQSFYSRLCDNALALSQQYTNKNAEHILEHHLKNISHNAD